MSNVRFINDNAADRAVLVTSATVAGLPSSNLLSDIKSKVCRSVSKNLNIKSTWATADETIRGVVLPFTNVSPTSTIRVRATNEASVTNIAGSSEIFNGPGWGAAGVTVLPFAAMAPDGRFTANKITGNGSLVPHNVQRTVTVVAGTTYTISVFAKAAENSWMYLDLTGAGGAYATFNIGTGVSGTSGTAPRAITPVAGMPGWYRVSITVTPTTPGTRTVSFSTQMSDIGTSDATSGGAYYWGLMMNAGPISSYYPSAQTFSSRASSGYYMGVDGLLVGVLSNVARMEYKYPSLGAVPPKLLVEAAGVNLLKYSEQLEHATYGKNAMTVESAVMSPDGAVTARRFQETTATDLHYLQQLVALTVDVVYTFSFFVKANGRSKLQVGNTTSGAFAAMDLATGTVFNGAGAGYVSSAISPYPNNWYRVSLTFKSTATSSQGMTLIAYDNSYTATYTGDGASGYFVWGWQLEENSTPTSYIPTVASATNRAADVVTTGNGTRPPGYMDWWQTYYYDSGTVLASPAPAVKLQGYTAAQASSAYGYGGGAYARIWLPSITVTALMIEIIDTNNLQGYVEASRLIIGDYWEPAGVGAEQGATMTLEDTSKSFRTDAGDLLTDVGPRYRKQEFSLPDLNSTDRNKMWDILWGNGTSKPVFISMYPNNVDTKLEQVNQLYGKLVKTPIMGTPYFNRHSASIEVEEI